MSDSLKNSGSEKEISADYNKLVMYAGTASVFIATVFILVKAGVWFASYSSSMFASLIDSMFDALTAIINLFAIRYSLTPPNDTYRFGHYKAQSLAALAQSAFIGGSAVILIIHGIKRLHHPEVVNNVDIAILVSVLAEVITLLLIAFQTYVISKTKSEAIAADRLHYLSDAMLNIGVILALVFSGMGYMWADGLFTIIIGALITKGAFSLGKTSVSTLLDISFPPEENQQIIKELIEIPHVESIHDLKTRRAGPRNFIQCHLLMDGNMSLKSSHEVTVVAEDILRKKYKDADISIHMEPLNKETLTNLEFDDITHVMSQKEIEKLKNDKKN